MPGPLPYSEAGQVTPIPVAQDQSSRTNCREVCDQSAWLVSRTPAPPGGASLKENLHHVAPCPSRCRRLRPGLQTVSSVFKQTPRQVCPEERQSSLHAAPPP